jgi:peptidoglycan/LPS O-acetylase OafA/YrhL
LGTETAALRNAGFRPDLQGLRAVAILLVVLAHAGVPGFAGGFVGVDVFFVLSGYLITGLLLRELEQTGRIRLLDFYARRLKRLLPAMIVMVAGTVGLAFWLLAPFEASAQLASSPYAITWTSNLYFLFSTFDYFDELASRDLFLHSWSLGVEEQFYLVWPLLLLVLISAGPARRGLVRSPIVLLSLVGVASLAFSLYLSSRWPHAAFYSMPARMWQFCLGAIVYVAFAPSAAGAKRGTRRSGRPVSWMALVSGIALIAGSAVGLHPNLVYPGLWALLPSIGTVLVIAAGYGLSAGHAGPLAHRSMVWLGDRSYSWYLWHWPILVLGYSVGFENDRLAVAGLVLFSLLAAMLSYRFVELPFWKGSFSFPRPLQVLPASIVVMAASLLASTHMVRHLQETGKAIEASYHWRYDFPEIYRLPCDAWFEHADVEPCVFGDENAEKTVVLLGDSIGVQWFSMVPEVFQEPGWRTVVLTKSGCAMVDVEYYYPRIGSMYEVCTEWRNAVLNHLDADKPDVIIVGSSAGYDFDEKQWVEGKERVLDRLTRAAHSVLIIPGTPSLGFDGPGCVTRHVRPGGAIGAHACNARNRVAMPYEVRRYLGKASEAYSNAHLLDLNDLICPGDICSAMDSNGIVVFRDSQHLTDSFVRAQAPTIRERVESFNSAQIE